MLTVFRQYTLTGINVAIHPIVNELCSILKERGEHDLSSNLAIAGLNYEKIYKSIVKEIIDTQTTWEDVLRQFELAEKELVKRDKDHKWVRLNNKWYVRSLPGFERTVTGGLSDIKFVPLLKSIVDEIVDTDISWEDVLHQLDLVGNRLSSADADHKWVKTANGYCVVTINKDVEFTPERLTKNLNWEVALSIPKAGKEFYFSRIAVKSVKLKPDEVVDSLLAAIHKIPNTKWQNLVKRWAIVSIRELKSVYKSAVGVYFPPYKMIVLPAPEVQRIHKRDASAVRTVLHEIGHGIDYTLGITEQVVAAKLDEASRRAARLFGQDHGDIVREGIAETISWLVISPSTFESVPRAKEVDKKFLALLADVLELDQQKRKLAGIPDSVTPETVAPTKKLLEDSIENNIFASSIALELDRPITEDERSYFKKVIDDACSSLPGTMCSGLHLKLSCKPKSVVGFDRDLDILLDRVTLHNITKPADIKPERLIHAIGHFVWDNVKDKSTKAAFSKNAAVFGLTSDIAQLKDKTQTAVETFAELFVMHFFNKKALPVSLASLFYKLIA